MTDIVIIGAGAAGIAAATRLVEHGFTNVRILEAEKRIGGRIHSTFLGDAFVDLGAEEVHGEKGNIVADLAERFLHKKTSLTKSTCFYSDGHLIDIQLRKDIMHFLEEFCEEDSKIQRSIGEVFTERFNSSETLSKYKQNSDNWKKATEFLGLCESFFSILEGPYSWNDVVLESGSHYVNCPGDQHMGWNGRGCKILLDILMKKVPIPEQQLLSDDRIILNKTVVKILWETDDKVEIECSDGSGYAADHVIFTPSVGVLKAKHRDIFDPDLPLEKVRIFEKVGFANVMKVAVEFSGKWWTGAPFGFVWSKKCRESIHQEFDKGPMVDGVSWLTSIHWLMESPDNDEVLVAWLTGPATPLIEEMTNEDIKNGVMFVMRKFLGREFKIPHPAKIIPSRWYTNPNFRGAYSYESVEASKLQEPLQTILAKPLLNENEVPVVLFAGEATHLTQFSTINGAILSGHREADRLIELHKDD